MATETKKKFTPNLGLTVNTLFEECKRLIKEGHGDKHIIISCDDEGNGFHTLFYSFCTKREDVASLLELEHDGTHTPDNCVTLG